MIEKNELPEGWSKKQLSEICSIKTGSKDVNEGNKNGQYPFFTCAQEVSAFDSYSFEGKSLLIAGNGNFSVKKYDGKFEAYQRTYVLQDIKIDYIYLYYFILYKLSDITKDNRGSTVRYIRIGDLINYPISIAPSDDQRLIVEKIETLFSELDNSVANLKAAKAQLKRYRQSVLKSAFEGKLTVAWREANGDKLETVEALMERIKAEREAAYASKSRKPKEISPLTDDEIADLPELPEGWSFVKLGAVIEEPKYGTSKKCDYETNGVGVLRIPNIANGIIDSEDLKFALFTDEEIEQYRLKSGDLLTIRSNGSVNLVGKTALVLPSDESYLYAGYLIRLRPYQFLADGKYLHYVLASHELRKQIEEKAKSTSGVNNINTGELQSLIIPFVQLDEQHQIVNEIESRLSEADVMERTIDESLIKAEKMRQSILKKAFEGKLC